MFRQSLTPGSSLILAFESADALVATLMRGIGTRRLCVCGVMVTTAAVPRSRLAIDLRCRIILVSWTINTIAVASTDQLDS